MSLPATVADVTGLLSNVLEDASNFLPPPEREVVAALAAAAPKVAALLLGEAGSGSDEVVTLLEGVLKAASDAQAAAVLK